MDTHDRSTDVLRAAAPTRPDWLPTAVWPFPRREVMVEGARVSVTDVGAGPTLLFSHAGQWSFLWRDLIWRLSDRFRCVTFDPPGFGLSERVPKDRQTLAAVRDTVATIIDDLDLATITLVMHDLGGVISLAAVLPNAERVEGLVAVNTFGWRPSGVMFRGMLALFGSAWMRETDAWSGFLPAMTSTRFGVGRHLDRPSRRAFRRGLDRPARRAMHRLFADARRSPEIYRQAELALSELLAHLPLLTVFGQRSDYLRFQPKWRRRFPDARQVVVPGGLHFPMADNPGLVADMIAAWHTGLIGPHVNDDGDPSLTPPYVSQ